jgi:hypothetical protein
MRIISIILNELNSDKLKAEEKLERCINNKGDLDENVSDIKKLLKEIVLNQNMMEKWKEYLPQEEDNKNNNKN